MNHISLPKQFLLIFLNWRQNFVNGREIASSGLSLVSLIRKFIGLYMIK